MTTRFASYVCKRNEISEDCRQSLERLLLPSMKKWDRKISDTAQCETPEMTTERLMKGLAEDLNRALPILCGMTSNEYVQKQEAQRLLKSVDKQLARLRAEENRMVLLHLANCMTPTRCCRQPVIPKTRQSSASTSSDMKDKDSAKSPSWGTSRVTEMAMELAKDRASRYDAVMYALAPNHRREIEDRLPPFSVPKEDGGTELWRRFMIVQDFDSLIEKGLHPSAPTPASITDEIDDIRDAIGAAQDADFDKSRIHQTFAHRAFVKLLINPFEKHTGLKATARPNDTFDQFVGILLADAYNRIDSKSHSRLIQHALEDFAPGDAGTQN